ncbi:GNAT family N-acetyltransferase [Streptomyces sp. NBC_01635]|uniref:GNAT family N-acetyltransferase n=1 Tax=Streptomyces sp. NBC_01635 TaxID=2975904 RepID=UPI003868757B|nr:GNAT family N-acetyltransferase [Streptomyces sp. NBC_01635]
MAELHILDERVFKEVAYPYFLMRQLVDIYSRHFLVLDDDEHIHGYVLAATSALSRESWILGLCVAMDHRGEGLGRLLMAAILKQLRSDGIHVVRLTVEPGNNVAVTLYECLGFVPEQPGNGFRSDYFGPGEHRLIMRLNLSGAA